MAALVLQPLAAHSPVQSAAAPAGGAADILALDTRWTVSFTTPLAAAAGFDEQLAYVPLEGGQLMAIDLDDGRVRWTTDRRTTSTPATGDGLVFAAEEEGVTALNQSDGVVVWRTPLPGPVSGQVYWDGGWVLVSTAAGDLLAAGAQDGTIRWRLPLGAPLATRPTVSGERLYVALTDGRVAALALESGEALWIQPAGADVTGLLALEEQLLVGTTARRLLSLSLDRGRQRWAWRALANLVGAPAADDRFIYFVAFDNVLRALDRRTGSLRWSRNLPSRPRGGPLRADDVVLVPFVTADIGAYRAAGGTEAFTIRALGELASVPFLRDAPRPTAPRLIAMSREGSLQGFAPRFEPPPAPMSQLVGVNVGHE